MIHEQQDYSGTRSLVYNGCRCLYTENLVSKSVVLIFLFCGNVYLSLECLNLLFLCICYINKMMFGDLISGAIHRYLLSNCHVPNTIGLTVRK